MMLFMDYKVIQKGPMQIVGIEIRTSNKDAINTIPPFWGRFYREKIQAQIPNQKTGEVLGLYCEYETDHTGPYTLVAGCEVTLAGYIPKGLVVKHIPAAKYAVFETSGKFPEKMMEVWEWVWQRHLKRTFVADFELYQIGFDAQSNTDVHVYIGIH